MASNSILNVFNFSVHDPKKMILSHLTDEELINYLQILVSGKCSALPFFSQQKNIIHFKQVLVQRVLLRVAQGQQEEANKILAAFPNFALEPNVVTDYSGRTFQEMTALQYAVWAKDVHMLLMILSNLIAKKDKEDFLEERKKLLDEMPANDCLNDLLALAIQYLATDVKQRISEQFEKLDQEGTKYGSRYDFALLIQSLQAFLDYNKCDSSGYSQKTWDAQIDQEYFIKVSQSQRTMPAHVANEFCRQDRSFSPLPSFNESELPRSLYFLNAAVTKKAYAGNYCTDDHVFPLNPHNQLNIVLSRHGKQFRVLGDTNRNVLENCGEYDLVAIKELDKVRTNQLRAIKLQLMPPVPLLKN